MVQFESATLIATDTWRLAGLLRGQAGTADIAAAGHDTGARFVLIDGAVRVLSLSAAESGLGLTLRCGPTGATYDPDVFIDVPLGASRRGLTCLAPVHVARPATPGAATSTLPGCGRRGSAAIAGIRTRCRLARRAKPIRSRSSTAPRVVRTLAAAAPSVTYSAADQVADFGALPATFHRSPSGEPDRGTGSRRFARAQCLILSKPTS